MDIFRSNQARDGKLVFPLLGGSRYWGLTRDGDGDDDMMMMISFKRKTSFIIIIIIIIIIIPL